MVTNCNKERPGSIVNEALKNRILILKDTSKESDFSLEEYVMAEEKFNEGGAGFSSIIIKKTMKK